MLEIQNVSILKRLSNVSITIPKGKLFGIMGPNGAGKSTLLKAIAGLVKLPAGTIKYDGKELKHLDRHTLSRTIHLVSQGFNIRFDYTVQDIVAMGCYHRGVTVEQALETVDATHLAKRPITQLSMGERQRIYLARALATCCPILLFDEPTANLDMRHQIEIWKLLQNLANQDRTILVTSHDLNMTRHFCPQTALIHHGECVASGNTEDVLTHTLIEEIFGVSLIPVGSQA